MPKVRMMHKSRTIINPLNLLAHCTENMKHIFPKMKLRSIITNSYIHVSVSDLYIPRIGLPNWPQQNKHADPVNM
jgi:hypothetical protein